VSSVAAVALIVCFVLVGMVWGISGDFLIGEILPRAAVPDV
jgi:hypothetical protein